jgi:uncharacterized cupin superfamily protein
MSKAQELREKLIRNMHDAPKEHWARAPLYENEGVSLSKGTAASKLGFRYETVPAGKRSCPYHFHYAQEELFIIIAGEGTLRVADELLPVKTGDVIVIPPGPAYPHQLINTSQVPLSYFSLSTKEYPEICEYPDSGKYLAWDAQHKDKGPLLQDGRMHRVKDDLEYWDGEA